MPDIYVSANYRLNKLSYDKLYYDKAIQNAINNIFNYLKYRPEFNKCVNFVNNNSDLITFLTKAVSKNIKYFESKSKANELIYQDASKTFGELTKELKSRLDKEMIAEDVFMNLLRDEFLKVKPLMEDLEKKIYNSI